MAIRKLKAKKKKTSKNATVMVFDPFAEEQFISTSSLGFDVLLSEKALGVEVGSLVEVAGDSGCGKSTSMFAMACNQARENDVKVVYVDAEGGIKPSHVRLNDAQELFHPDTTDLINEYGDKLSTFLEKAFDGYNMVVLQANSFNGLDDITKAIYNWTEGHDEALVFIIDSLAFLSTTSELDDSQADKAWVGQKAKAWRAWMTLNKINLNAHGVTTYFINHLTMQGIGGFLAKPKADSAGGSASKYGPDIRVFIKEGEKIYDKNEDIIGNEAKVYTKKCRNNISHRQVIIPLIKGTGPDNARFIKNILNEQDLVKFGAWTTFDFPFLDEPAKVQGSEGALDFIRKHEEDFTKYLHDEDLLSLSQIGEKVKEKSDDPTEINPDDDDED